MSQKSYDGKPSLYLIATPIGNMEDITYRAIETMKNVEVIFSEDTRITNQLLKHFNIQKKLIASHQYNEIENKDKLLFYLSQGYDVGLVTDRGTPIISDPGYELARIAMENGYNVIAIPGVTACVAALIVSGLPPQPFMFYGFLNSKSTKRKKELEELKGIKSTIIFYEAPHRLQEMLQDLLQILGNRRCSISREITKKYEEVYRGTIEDVIAEVKDAKGEFVVVVEGASITSHNYDHLTIVEHVNLYIKEGYSSKDAIKMVAKERQVNKNEVYMEYHKDDAGK